MGQKKLSGQENQGDLVSMTASSERRIKDYADERVRVILTTDGSCKPNPGSGGWGCILRYTNGGGREVTKELSGGERDTTNNRMEMTAVIQGLAALKRPCRVTVVTDSQIVVGGMTGWKRNRNVDLWKRLDEIASRHAIEWRYVRGHAGHADNERCDELASREARLARRGPTSEVLNIQKTPAEADAAS